MPANSTRTPAWGKLRFADGTQYQLTGDDVLWTARATVYEGGDAAATLWTLAQRFEKARRNYPSFAAFVRAFSQPVNPAWAADGRFCAPGGTHAQGPYCTPDKLERRAQAASASLEELADRAPAVVDTVLAWARAELRNPVPRATNFADPAVASSYLRQTPGASLLLDAGNWYLIEPWAQNWRRNKVVVAMGSSLANADSAGGFFAHVGTAIGSRLLSPISPVRFFRNLRNG